MAAIAGAASYSFLLTMDFLTVISLHTARSLWIATALALHPGVACELSCYDGVDWKKLVKSMEALVLADCSGGHCSSIHSAFEQGTAACIFGPGLCAGGWTIHDDLRTAQLSFGLHAN